MLKGGSAQGGENEEGWLITITTPQFKGGDPMVETYAAWISDPVEALAAVEQLAKPTNDTPPETLAEIPAAQLRGLGLTKKGEVRLIFLK